MVPKIGTRTIFTTLALSIAGSLAAVANNDPQQSVRERMEKLQLDRQEQAEQARKNYERMHAPIRFPPIPPFRRMSNEATNRRLDENLAKAKLARDELKNQTKTADYVIAQVNLANAYHDSRNREKAAAIYREAFESYLKLQHDVEAEKQARESLWKHLGYFKPADFDSIYPQLLKKSLNTQEDSSSLAAHIRQALYERNADWPEARLDERLFYKAAIDTVSSLKKTDSKLMSELLQGYGSELTQARQFKEADVVFKRISELSSNNPIERERNEWELQQFYVQHEMDDEASQHFAKLPISQYALSIRGESLADAYLKRGQIDNAEKILNMFYNNPDVNALNNVDRVLEPMVTGQIQIGNLDRAQKLLTDRVAASKRFSNDYNGHKWFFKLSQVDLALGKTADSEKLFQQVRIYTALTRGDMNKLNDERMKMVKATSK